MYFVLGVLTAGLLALAVAPAMWRRADRLARSRIEGALPMSLAEIQAEKDQLRAEFAMSARRLEMKAEHLESGANGRLMEISRSRTEIARLEADRSAKTQTIEGLEARIAELATDLERAETRIVEAKTELVARDEKLAAHVTRLTGLESELAASQLLSEEQKLELVARDTTIGNLDDSLADAKATATQTGLARDALAAELESERANLGAERRRAEGLEARIAAFEAERADRLATLERRAGEIKALEAELAAEQVRREKLVADIAQLEAERTERLRELTRRSEEIDTLRAELQKAREATHRDEAERPARREAEAVADGDNVRKAMEAAEAEKLVLAGRLAALEDDHASLRAENAELRRVAGTEWEAQRAADQRLRERLSEVASSVVRMTQSGAPPVAATNGENGNGENGNGDAAKHATPVSAMPPAGPAPARPSHPDTPRPVEGRSLAERIRALQHAAARH